MHPVAKLGKGEPREWRELMQSEIQHMVEKERLGKAVEIRQQSLWTQWEGKQITSLVVTSRTRFLLDSVYDVFPRPFLLF